MTYFNSTRLTGDDLRTAVQQAGNQDAVVMAIYRAANGPLSASQVWRECERQGRYWPVTSVRRSISNLSNAGALVHLQEATRPGLYGRAETLYSLPDAGQKAAA